MQNPAGYVERKKASIIYESILRIWHEKDGIQNLNNRQGSQHIEALNIQELMNDQDQVLKEVALMAARGYDPTAELEKENNDLEEQLQQMIKYEKETFMKVRALEYENEILFGKSNSMGHSIQNYGKRLEELGKQIDELNAILRIKDQEMIEMTNDIHSFKVMRENMRKEQGFRRQRYDQLENNIRRVIVELGRASSEQQEFQRTLHIDLSEIVVLKEENKRLKSTLERVRQELIMDEHSYEQLKQKVNDINLSINKCESQMFSAKNQIDRLKNEREQIKVELSYAKATVENQRQAQEKLQKHYQKQKDVNNQLDFQLQALTLNEGGLQQPAINQQIQSQFKEQKQQLDENMGIFESDKRVTFNSDHKRSSSQDKTLVQARNFQSSKSIHESQQVSKRLDQISAHNSSRIKTILFDLSDPQTSESISITGQKRRGGVTSQTREGQVVNRNFVHQMSNILVWNDADNSYQKTQKNRDDSLERIKVNSSFTHRKAEQTVLSFKERHSMPDHHEQSFRFGRDQKQQQNTAQNYLSIHQQQGEDEKSLKRDPAQIKQMKDNLNIYLQRREKINAEINKVSDKTRNGEEKRNNLEEEMKTLSKKIGDIKLQLRKMDALKNNF